ncbi:MAG: murein L,D-transpeptidase catalytic domain family protein [Chitinophagaceae bacterium]
MQKPIFTSSKRTPIASFKKVIKGFYLLLSSLFLSMVHLPLSFAKLNSMSHAKKSPGVVVAPQPGPLPGVSQRFFSVKSVYDSLRLDLSGLSRQAFDYAQQGWEKLIIQGKVMNQSVMTIVDFSQSSSQKRLYILDMENYKVLFNTLVAHGRNSGKEWASSFSNRASSFKSSPGFYITGDTYNGENGYSLKLTGVEKGINDNALNRAIVMHGADYVNQSFIETQGYIGRSLGCPAVPRRQAVDIINTIKSGACLFIYTPGIQYVSHSAFLSNAG